MDEVTVGDNWKNSAAVELMEQGSASASAVPQIIIAERSVRPDGGALTVSGEHVLARYIGPDAIEAWVQQGAPIPGAPSTSGMVQNADQGAAIVSSHRVSPRP